TVVSSAFEGLSKPSRCRFLVKNSEMEISRCFCAIDSAVARRAGAAAGLAGFGVSGMGATEETTGFTEGSVGTSVSWGAVDELELLALMLQDSARSTARKNQ